MDDAEQGKLHPKPNLYGDLATFASVSPLFMHLKLDRHRVSAKLSASFPVLIYNTAKLAMENCLYQWEKNSL